MTGSGSKTSSEGDASSRPFVEDDSHPTELPYDKGGVPLYIALAWAVFIVTYITVMSMVALPDLRDWLGR
jgi:hypothetical protein